MSTANRHHIAEEPMSIGQAVVLLQAKYPDVTHSSMRFLEREGLLESVRTTGGHRLYSRADLERVGQIKRWQREGLTLGQVRDRLRLRKGIPEPAQLSAQFYELIRNDQIEQAQRLILDADRAGLPPETIFFDVLEPALVAIGHGWAKDEVPVFQEKEASEICRELISDITLRHAPDFAEGPLLVAACVEGEFHEIGLRMVYGLLRQHGYRVRYLGANVATPFLVSAVQANKPEAVLLSSSVEESFPGCLNAVTELRAIWPAQQAPLILVGGEIARNRESELRAAGAIPVQEAHAMTDLPALLSTAQP